MGAFKFSLISMLLTRLSRLNKFYFIRIRLRNCLAYLYQFSEYAINDTGLLVQISTDSIPRLQFFMT